MKTIEEYYENDENLFLVLDEIMREEQERENQNNKKNERLLKVIESVKGKEFVEELRSYIVNLEHVGLIEIVEKSVGQYQSEEYQYPLIKEAWVLQYVGYCGDDYSGFVCIEIKRENKKTKYLNIPYWM
jgi:hypothetical protein